MLIEDLANGNKSAKDTIMMLSASIQEARFEEQKERMKIVNRIVAIGDGAENEEKGKSVKQLAADCTVIIKPLEEQKKRIESSMKLKRGICRTLNADLKEFKLKRGKKGTVRKTLEKVLRSHGVYVYARNKNSWVRRSCSGAN